MDTTQASQWKRLDCKALAATGVPPGFGCSLYGFLGPLVGGVTDYRYKIAPDRSSLVIRSNTGESPDVQFSLDVNLGYEIQLRGGKDVHECGDPRHDVNPATGKRDYLHLHLHELISLRPTSDYGLRATFSHRLSPDAACTIQTLPLMHKDLTTAIIAFEGDLLSRAEDQLKQKVIGSSEGLQAGTNDLWQRLQQPFTMVSPLGPYQVLLHPTTVALSLLRTSGGGNQELVTGSILLGVSLEMRTNFGTPIAAEPRPPLGERAAPGRGNEVAAVATADYNFVSTALRERLAERQLRYGPFGSIRVIDVTVFPASSSKAAQLVAATRYRGNVRGVLYAWGTPTYDVATDKLSVPDLQIAPSPHGLASEVALMFVRQRKLLKTARADAVISPSALLAKVIPERSFIASEAADQVVLSGHLDRITFNRIALTRPGITAGLEVHGSADIRASFNVKRLLSR
jgi:hypothetical protein